LWDFANFLMYTIYVLRGALRFCLFIQYYLSKKNIMCYPFELINIRISKMHNFSYGEMFELWLINDELLDLTM
jgi:hypothetical protein